VKGIRWDTLDAICTYLECQPGDILEHVPNQRAQAPPDKARRAG